MLLIEAHLNKIPRSTLNTIRHFHNQENLATAGTISTVLQYTTISFRFLSRSRFLSSARIQPYAACKLALSSVLRLPHLTVKPLLPLPRDRGGALVARMADSAAGSYAIALADVAHSNGILDQTMVNLEKVENIFSDDELVSFFSNPTIADGLKREILGQISESSGLQQHVVNFLNILVDMERINQIHDIAKEFEAIYNK